MQKLTPFCDKNVANNANNKICVSMIISHIIILKALKIYFRIIFLYGPIWTQNVLTKFEWFLLF